MGGELEAELVTVGSLFADGRVHYEIPIYQRNYAWGVEQIEQLIDDVWAARAAGGYFLGNLIVARQEVGQQPGTVAFEVVDGQQRLTTLFLLLRYLDVEAKGRLTYQSRRSATDALARISDSEEEESAGIHAGFKAIKSRMGRLTTDDQRAFSDFLRHRVHLVRATLPNGTDLNKYFEIMNTRGQQLAQVDIIKARLMSYLRGEDLAAQRRCLAWVWDACADMDSYIQMALTPKDHRVRKELVRNKIFGDSWDSLGHCTFDRLVEWQPQRDDAGAEPTRESLSLGEALLHYATEVDLPNPEDPENQRFESPIKFPILLLHALKVLRGPAPGGDDDGNLDDSRLIKLFDEEFKPLPQEQRAARTREFVETLLRCKFVLDNYVIKRMFTSNNGPDGAWSLKRLTKAQSASGGTKVSVRFPNAFSPGKDEWEDAPIDAGTRDVLLLQSMLRVTYTSPRTMHWVTEVLREPLAGLPRQGAAERIRQILVSHARTKVQQALFAGKKPTGFGIERIVFTYLDYLLVTGKSPDRRADPSFTFVFRNSIEHFFPQFPDREQEHWDRIKPDDEELHMLGNLALVSVGANSKFSNNLPEFKVKYEDTIEQSAKLQLMAQRVLDLGKDGRTWDRDAVRDHDAAMRSLLHSDLLAGGLVVG